jgi:hypothetical protein
MTISSIEQQKEVVIEQKKKLQLSPLVMPVLGTSIILLAVISYITQLPLTAIFSWLERMFSVGFIVIFSMLVALGLVAIMQLKNLEQASYWHEVGQQAGNGISTLALTFTLLGISLGIGTLAEQPLSPDNVQEIISGLTKQFSMAFMTTVVGLPVATVIRALVAIKYQKITAGQENQ